MLLVAMSFSQAVYAFSGFPHKNTRQQPPEKAEMTVFKLDQAKSLAEILEHEQHARVILVGETHTRYDHHLVQLEALRQLHETYPRLALGVEWFQQPFQQHLDDFIAGTISEQQMLHKTEYFTRWSYDYRLYRPIMQFAREHGIPVIALNASTELRKALSQHAISDLPEDMKAQLPDSYDWSDKAYEKRLTEVFKMHPNYPGEFEDFLRGQLTWDESMAHRAATFIQQHPENRMLVLAGSGHLQFGSGIPNRIKRRVDVDLVTILFAEGAAPVSPDMADYIVMSARYDLEPVGLIGAYLDSTNQRVIVKDFSSNSALKDAGMEKGIVIVGVDDEKVQTNADFRLAMLDKRAGDTIELHYLENAEEEDSATRSIEIKLR